ncbi:DUF2686 family protein, partial [Shigella flexneri]|uniref:DUF2686 family protein n=2 Tax=Shigella flexneri TaxID=623 RepID=UPI0020967A8E
GNGSHASTLKSPSYTKSVSWQHYPIIGIEAYPGTAEIHSKMGYNVIPGDENAPLKRMTLQPSSLPELFELKNGEWNYIGK